MLTPEWKGMRNSLDTTLHETLTNHGEESSNFMEEKRGLEEVRRAQASPTPDADPNSWDGRVTPGKVPRFLNLRFLQGFL